MPNDDQYFQEFNGEPTLKSLTALVRKIADEQRAIHKRLDLMVQQNDELDKKMADLYRAFPGGDIDGHRLWHKTQLEILEEKRRIRQAIIEKSISGLVWSAFVAGGALVWKGFLTYLGK